MSPSPKEILLDLIDSEDLAGGRIPEIDLSPTQILVELVDVERTGEGSIPEFDPHPDRLWVDLVDLEGMHGRRVPYMEPRPSQVLVELLDDGEMEEDALFYQSHPSQKMAREEGAVVIPQTGDDSENEDETLHEDQGSGGVVQFKEKQITTPHVPPGISRIHIGDHNFHLRWNIVGPVRDRAVLRRHKQRLLDSAPVLEQLIIQYSSFSAESANDLASALQQLTALKVVPLLPDRICY